MLPVARTLDPGVIEWMGMPQALACRGDPTRRNEALALFGDRPE